MTKTFDKSSIIKIEGGYVVVDKEANVRGGDWFYMEGTSDSWATGLRQAEKGELVFGHFKVIASIGKRIEGVPFIELPSEIEIPKHFISDREISSYKQGYKAAQSKGQYSEEDVLKACELAGQRAANANNYSEAAMKEEVLPFLKSLQTKRPISVELEYEPDLTEENKFAAVWSYKLKITNPETNTIIPIKIEFLPS